MKNLVSLLLVLISCSAFATKARMQALNSSFHLIDPQTIFGNPLDLMSMKNFISFDINLEFLHVIGGFFVIRCSFVYSIVLFFRFILVFIS